MNSYTHGISGGDAYFIEFAKRIDKFEKIVVTSLLGKKICREKGLEAHYFITTREQNFKHIIPTYFRRIINAILLNPKIDDGDIVYSTSDFLPDVIPAFLQKINNKKIAWIQKIYHLIPSKRFIPHYAQKISFLFIKNLADLVIVDNGLLKNELISQGFKANKTEVNHLGIDMRYLIANNKNVPQDKRYDAVFLGRIHRSKGVFDLIAIWKLIIEKKPNAQLAIIGRGDRQVESELGRGISNAGLGRNIIRTGYIEEEEKAGIMNSSKIFVFPSHEEGFGLAVCEAMACGLPVVAWDLPVYKDVFLKGMVQVSKGDIEHFAKAVWQLLVDEQLYRKISREAKELVLEYDCNSTIPREIEFIERLAIGK